MEQITTQLKQLGLGDYEARIYAVLLATSPASATYVAKKCRLSRSSVYTTLAVLTSKGLVGTTYRNNVKQFIAQDETALDHLLKRERSKLEEKFRAFGALRDSLHLLRRPPLGVPRILLFEGQEGLKKIYLSMMQEAPTGATLYLLRDEFVWSPEWKFIFNLDWHERVKRIKTEKNITTKLLVNGSALEKKHDKFYKARRGLAHRYLPAKERVDDFALYVLGDTVSVLSMEKNNLVGVKIVNDRLAKNFQRMSEMLWNAAGH